MCVCVCASVCVIGGHKYLYNYIVTHYLQCFMHIIHMQPYTSQNTRYIEVFVSVKH